VGGGGGGGWGGGGGGGVGGGGGGVGWGGGGGGGGEGFRFSVVPNMFLLHSLQVLNMFLMFPMCSQWHLALIPYVLPKVLPFSPISVGQRGRHFIFP